MGYRRVLTGMPFCKGIYQFWGNWGKINLRKINITSGELRTLLCNGLTVPTLTVSNNPDWLFLLLFFFHFFRSSSHCKSRIFVSTFISFLVISKCFPEISGAKAVLVLCLDQNMVFPDFIPFALLSFHFTFSLI